MMVASELFKLVNEELRKENKTDCIIKVDSEDDTNFRIVLLFSNGLCKVFDENLEQLI